MKRVIWVLAAKRQVEIVLVERRDAQLALLACDGGGIYKTLFSPKNVACLVLWSGMKGGLGETKTTTTIPPVGVLSPKWERGCCVPVGTADFGVASTLTSSRRMNYNSQVGRPNSEAGEDNPLTQYAQAQAPRQYAMNDTKEPRSPGSIILP